MRVRACLGVVLASWLVLAAPAHAAFPGRNGMLAVQPLHGSGLILVDSDGSNRQLICTSGSECGHPARPMFSPDGRAILFAGPAIRLVGTDGSCMNCQFGASASPAFRPGGTLITFVSGGKVVEDSIDGLRQAQPATGVAHVSAAVWSASGELAAVARGRVWVGRPGHLRTVGSGGSPSWSPDGSRLAIVRRGWVTIVGVARGSARRLVGGTAPAYSPDGRWIAFVDRRHRVRVIRSGGGRARAVGSVRGVAVDWQPLPVRPAPCVAPSGSQLLASSAQAVVTGDAAPRPAGGDPADTAVMGCLFADGRERLLERSMFNSIDDATDFPLAAVGGAYAAIVSDNYDEHYGGATETVGVFDLRTGERSGFGGESSCGPYSEPTCGGIDQLVVGSDGVSAVHVDGGPAGPNSDPLAVLCASESLCLATDSFGEVVSSTSPTQGPWSTSTGASMDSGGAGGGSCPSVSLCVLVAGPSIFTSTDPAAGSWTRTNPPGSPLFLAVDCPTASLCVATTSRGQIAVSTDPTGGPSAWTVEDVDGSNAMYGISCPDASECVATDLAGNVITSSDPTGGPSAWSVRKIGYAMSNVSCPSTSLCVAQTGNSGVEVSTDPLSGQWTSTPLRPQIQDLSCPSSSLCVQVAGNTVGFSTDPASGAWSSYTVNSSLQSISCPTTTFCVAAGDGDGQVLVSTDPAGGPSAWTPVLADKGRLHDRNRRLRHRADPRRGPDRGARAGQEHRVRGPDRAAARGADADRRCAQLG